MTCQDHPVQAVSRAGLLILYPLALAPPQQPQTVLTDGSQGGAQAVA